MHHPKPYSKKLILRKRLLAGTSSTLELCTSILMPAFQDYQDDDFQDILAHSAIQPIHLDLSTSLPELGYNHLRLRLQTAFQPSWKQLQFLSLSSIFIIKITTLFKFGGPSSSPKSAFLNSKPSP